MEISDEKVKLPPFGSQAALAALFASNTVNKVDDDRFLGTGRKDITEL